MRLSAIAFTVCCSVLPVGVYAESGTQNVAENNVVESPVTPAPDSTGTVTDIDGNVYKTVKIGDQWWMAENLKVTHYRNGDPVPHVTDRRKWGGLETGAYCNYGNDEGNVAVYGRLYNWYVVNDSRNIAPEHWRVPSVDDWQILIDYLGRDSVAGGKLKEVGTTHWSPPNEGATNESGFTALPGGYRSRRASTLSDDFEDLGADTYIWSSTEHDGFSTGKAIPSAAWCWSLHYFLSRVNDNHHTKRYGYSVRCVRNY